MKLLDVSRQITIVTLLVAAFTGCSKELTREKAYDLISEHENLAGTIDITIPVGSFWYDQRFLNVQPVTQLATTKFLTLRTIGESSGYRRWQQYLVELTPAGSERSAHWTRLDGSDAEEALRPFHYGSNAPDAVAFKIRLAERRLNEVIGLGIVNENQRQADFTWHWEPTEEGNALLDGLPTSQVKKGSATCQRYDDGWRVVHLELNK